MPILRAKVSITYWISIIGMVSWILILGFILLIFVVSANQPPYKAYVEEQEGYRWLIIRSSNGSIAVQKLE